MRHVSLYAAAIAAIGIVPCASAQEPTHTELQAQLQALSDQVAKLEKTQTEHVKKADVDATVEAVLNDAQKQSELLDVEGFTAGWSNGRFFLGSADGNFLMRPSALMQFRNTTTYRENGKASGNDDMQNGFEIRRMKFGVDGNAFSKDLTYAFLISINRSTGASLLEDAYVKYKFSDDWGIKAGQYKDPFAHESLTVMRYFMAAERSLTNDFFSPGENYVQGVSLVFDSAKCPARMEVAFTDGSVNNSNQNFQDFPTNHADWGVAGRVEYKVMGDWKNYLDYTAMGTKEDLLVVGGGLDYTEAGDTDVFSQTLDVQYENPNGLGIYGALYGRYTKNAPVTGPATFDDTFDWGSIAQISYMWNTHLEPFARWGYLHIDDNGSAGSNKKDVNEITIGANYYMQGHAAKFTLDAGYLPNGSPVDDNGAGILVNKDDEFYLRGQFTLLL